MTYPMLPDEYQRLARVQSAHEQELFDKENVVGVAIGNKYVNGEDTGRLSIVVFVSAKMPPDIIPEDQMLPSSLDDVLVDVRESGYFQPQQVQGPGALRLRPAVGGLSISHQNGGSGTLGTACIDDFAPGSPLRYHVLSNAHVLALPDLSGLIGDPVIQPGGSDGGRFPVDSIGTLARTVPISFPVDPTQPQSAWPNNLVDAAIATCQFRDINREVHWIGYPRQWTTTAIQALQVGSRLQKTGRTTGFTTGEVTGLNATVIVGPYGAAGSAKFSPVIVTTNMSAAGDSGSLVCNLEGVGIGLLFAGGGTETLVCQLPLVTGLLSVRIGERV
jgi:hypothetical protein